MKGGGYGRRITKEKGKVEKKSVREGKSEKER